MTQVNVRQIDAELQKLLDAPMGSDHCDGNEVIEGLDLNGCLQPTLDGSRWVRDGDGKHYMIKEDGSVTQSAQCFGFGDAGQINEEQCAAITELLAFEPAQVVDNVSNASNALDALDASNASNASTATTQTRQRQLLPPNYVPPFTQAYPGVPRPHQDGGTVDPALLETVRWETIQKVNKIHPRAVLKFLKANGFCLVSQNIAGTKLWIVEPLARWISSGDWEKGHPNLDKATLLLKRSYLCFLNRLVNVANTTNAAWIDGNGRAGVLPADVAFGTDHEGLHPKAVAERRAMTVLGGPAALFIRDIRGLRNNALQMGGNREITLSIKGDDIYGLPAVTYSYDNVEVRTAPQSGGGKTQVGGNLVHPVGFVVERRAPGTNFKDMYHSIKRRLASAGIQLQGEEDINAKVAQYNKLHEEVEKTLRGLAIVVRHVNDHGFNNGSKYLNIQTVETLADHYNNTLRRAIRTEVDILDGLEGLVGNVAGSSGSAKRAIQ